MDLLQIIILGIVQGLTEWLPVSSSGHLVILQHFFGIKETISLTLFLHLGTLASVFALFWKDIMNIIRSLVRFNYKSENGKLGLLIILATIPTVIIAFLFKEMFESFFSSIKVVGYGLMLTGYFLFLCERFKRKAKLNWFESILIGIAQGIAIIPGISRSGATIGTGMLLGIDKEKVAKFSFLLSIPAILGATILEAFSGQFSSASILPGLLGGTISAVIGYASIKFLLKIIKKQKFFIFAFYCWGIGLLVLLFV